MPYTFIFLFVFLDLVIRIHPWKKNIHLASPEPSQPAVFAGENKTCSLGPSSGFGKGPTRLLKIWCGFGLLMPSGNWKKHSRNHLSQDGKSKIYQDLSKNLWKCWNHQPPWSPSPDSPWQANEALDIAEPNSPGSQFQLSQPRETNGKNSKIWKESTVRKEKQRETAALMIFRTTRSALMINDSIKGRVMPGPLSFQVSTTEKKGSLAWIESARACDGDLTGQDSGCPLVMV